MAGPKRPAHSNLRWAIMIGIIAPLTFVMSLDRTNIAVSAPIIQKQFHFTLVEMGLILSAFTWTYAFLQIPGGLLAERWGARRTLTWANAWWSVWTVLTAAGSSVATFIGIRGLLGIGQATDWSASVEAINRWFPKQERARGNSILLAGLYLGPIVGAPLTVAIVKGLGWQWAFYIYGAAGVITAILWWTYFRDRPQDHPRISQEELDHIEAGYEASDQKERSTWRDWGQFLGNYRFWALGLQYFFLIFVQSFYTTWLPTYLIQARHFSLTAMGFGASLPWVALFAVVLISGQWQDRVYRRTGSKARSRVPFAVSGFILAALFLILASRESNTALMLIFLMLSLGSVGLVQTAIWPAVGDVAGNLTGSVTGWTNFWGNFSGGLGPIFTALLVTLTKSWGAALLVMSLAALIGAVLWLLIRPDEPLASGIMRPDAATGAAD